MKIGILTYHFSNNYGALFQAYGLRNWFLEQGVDAEFINYHPEHVESGGKVTFSNIFSIATVKILFLKLINIKEKIFGNKEQKKGFIEFKKNILGIHNQEYKTLEELNDANLDYDILICGSDQIWNPSEQYGVDPVYFLDFKTKKIDTLKISYAPSFGKDELNERFKQEIKNLISKLDVVSVREKSGVKIIENLLHIDVSLVPDPTVLVSNYEKIMKKYEVEDDNFVFCYYLRSRINIGETAEYIASTNNYSLYSPHNPHRRWKEVGHTIYPSPDQWLYLLNKSKFVVTNSFHGTILSILLNKPFVVVGIGGDRAKYNARALNILDQCGLKHRFVQEFDRNNIDNLLNEEINWNKVNIKVKKLRTNGESFLKKACHFE